jgi:hypothetical protein
MFLGDKGWPPSVSRLSRENVGASASHNLKAITACYRDSFTVSFNAYIRKSLDSSVAVVMGWKAGVRFPSETRILSSP